MNLLFINHNINIERGEIQKMSNLKKYSMLGILLLFLCVTEAGARIVAIGSLSEAHDPSLILRKGRSVRVHSMGLIKSNIGNIDSDGYFRGGVFRINKDIHDDSGQFCLLPDGAYIYCLFKISREQDKLIINISAMEMILHPNNDFSILFSDPPRLRNIAERGLYPPPPFIPGVKQMQLEMKQRSIELFIQMQEQIFISPTMSAELIWDVESENNATEHGKIVFGENASGDKTATIEWGNQIDLQVRKDILFSAHFTGIWREMQKTGVVFFRYHTPWRN